MKSITSASNAHYRLWKRLATQPRAARAHGLALAEGLHLTQAALDAAAPIEAVLLRQGSSRPMEVQVAAARAEATGAQAFELTATLFDLLAPVEHGVGLMLVIPVPERPLPVASRYDLLYLDGVQDPGNAGALLRTAAAAGIREVLASPTTAALWAPKTLRAGQGAHFRLHLHEHVRPEALAETLDGVWIGAAAHDAPSLWSTVLPAGALGWVFGAEGAGLSSAAQAVCVSKVSIPIDTAAESLNVAAAAAICLFERRRRLVPSP